MSAATELTAAPDPLASPALAPLGTPVTRSRLCLGKSRPLVVPHTSDRAQATLVAGFRTVAWLGRLGAVRADVAEARAVREDLRTDLFRWVVAEVQAGRMLIPPAELLRLVTDADVQALDTLARSDVDLDLRGTVADRVTDVVAAVRDGRRAG